MFALKLMGIKFFIVFLSLLIVFENRALASDPKFMPDDLTVKDFEEIIMMSLRPPPYHKIIVCDKQADKTIFLINDFLKQYFDEEKIFEFVKAEDLSRERSIGSNGQNVNAENSWSQATKISLLDKNSISEACKDKNSLFYKRILKYQDKISREVARNPQFVKSPPCLSDPKTELDKRGKLRLKYFSLFNINDKNNDCYDLGVRQLLGFSKFDFNPHAPLADKFKEVIRFRMKKHYQFKD